MSNSTKFGWIDYFKQENWFDDLFNAKGDPRTKNTFMLRTPEPMLTVVVAYLLFVFVAPRIMRNRAPMNIKNIIIVYNFLLVGLSGYMCFEFTSSVISLGYGVTCHPDDWTLSEDPLHMRLVSVGRLFFYSKIIELTDTVLFVLRKKNNHVSFLHVYHHASVICTGWVAVRYVPVGHSFVVGFLNSGVHTIMYIYYLLSAFGPSMQKYLWWKKYMTKIQLTQFAMIMFHYGYNMFVLNDCGYMWLIDFMTFYYMWTLIALFCNFYYQTYVRTKRQLQEKRKQ